MWNATRVISAYVQGAPQMVFAPPVLRGAGRLTPLPQETAVQKGVSSYPVLAKV